MSNAFDYNTGDFPTFAIVLPELGYVFIRLADGRVISDPLAHHPWLANANALEQGRMELNPFSVVWPDLGEGIDIQDLLQRIQQELPGYGVSILLDEGEKGT